jgi:hypothetical protein
MVLSREDSEKMNARLVKLLLILGCSIVAFLMVYEVVGNSYNSVKTEIVYERSSLTTIDTKVFVVRDEVLLSNNFSGILVPLIKDGEKVAKGDPFAVVCNSAEDAAMFLEKEELKADITRYENLRSKQSLTAVNIDKLDKETDLIFTNMLVAASNSQLMDFEKLAADFRDMLTSRQLAVSTPMLELDTKLSQLKARLAEIEAKKIFTQSLISDYSGYYISGTDGHENLIQFEGISEISPTVIDAAITKGKDETHMNSAGKIVASFDWYLLTSVENSKAATLKNGDITQILVGRSGEIKVPAAVHQIKPSNDEKTLIVFVCNQMNEDYAGIRTEEAKIVLKEQKGYRIKSSAVRIKDNIQGVFIVRGNVVGFRRVDIIESNEEYVLAAIIPNNSNTKSPYNIELYDEVIVEGKNLYEGKIIRR